MYTTTQYYHIKDLIVDVRACVSASWRCVCACVFVMATVHTDVFAPSSPPCVFGIVAPCVGDSLVVGDMDSAFVNR